MKSNVTKFALLLLAVVALWFGPLMGGLYFGGKAQAVPSTGVDGSFDSGAVSVTTSTTTLITMFVKDYRSVAVEVVNNSGDSLTNFLVELQDHPSGEWYPALQGSDYASAISKNLYYVYAVGGTAVSPTTLTAADTTHIKCFCDAYQIRFRAVSASTSSVTVRGIRLTTRAGN